MPGCCTADLMYEGTAASWNLMHRLEESVNRAVGHNCFQLPVLFIW